MLSDMKMIVWLGNPGKKYAHTRHNVGFLAVEYIQKTLGAEDWQNSRFQALIAKTPDILFIKPITYMNLSGDAVRSIAHFYKIPLRDILILSDDIDMEFGKVRYREKWSHGGQNGLRDIITKMWGDTLARIKIGIGRSEYMNTADWVLSRFTTTELKYLEDTVFPEVADRIHTWLS